MRRALSRCTRVAAHRRSDLPAFTETQANLLKSSDVRIQNDHNHQAIQLPPFEGLFAHTNAQPLRCVNTSAAAARSLPSQGSAVDRSGERDLSTCWKCSEALSSEEPFFCPSCGAIQPARQDADYFHLMGL